MKSNLWMIHPTTEHELRAVLARDIDAEQQAARPVAAEPADVVDGVARVKVHGFLAGERDRWLDYFGVAQTSYPDIVAQVREADADPKVRKIELHVDSGGGEASNQLIDAADAVFAAAKPVTAVVGNMAASAAYWIASQADSIVLSGPASMVGSIGVAVDAYTREDRVSIASTDAPRKRPDPATEAGRADIRRVLDDMHTLFVEAVARGREVSADTVNIDFGKGGMMLAEQALAAGMADAQFERAGVPSRAHATVTAMTPEEYESAHPKEHAKVFEAGVAKERSRVVAHLKLGKASGQMDASAEHIKAGLSVSDDTVQAEHLAAAITSARQSDRKSDDAPPLVAGAPPKTDDGPRAEDIDACFAAAGLVIPDGASSH